MQQYLKTTKLRLACIAVATTSMVALVCHISYVFMFPNKGFPDTGFKKASQAVVKVLPYTPNREFHPAGGTGFFVKTKLGDLYILSNRHVCEANGPNETHVIIVQGLQVYTSKILAKSNLSDLCIIIPPLQMKKQKLAAYELASNMPEMGDRLAVYGHPYLRPLTISHGTYLNTTREPVNMNYTFTPDKILNIARVDFMVAPGNSGSPVVNESGELVGVVFALEGPNRSGLFVPLGDIVNFLDTWE